MNLSCRHPMPFHADWPCGTTLMPLRASDGLGKNRLLRVGKNFWAFCAPKIMKFWDSLGEPVYTSSLFVWLPGNAVATCNLCVIRYGSQYCTSDVSWKFIENALHESWKPWNFVFFCRRKFLKTVSLNPVLCWMLGVKRSNEDVSECDVCCSSSFSWCPLIRTTTMTLRSAAFLTAPCSRGRLNPGRPRRGPSTQGPSTRTDDQ